MVELGAILRQRREAAGLSLRSLSKQLDVDAAYLSRIENGSVPPSEQLLRRLGAVLHLNEDELLLLAGRLPESLRHFVALEPRKVAAALTDLAAMVVAEPTAAYGVPALTTRGERAIEDGFPFAELSEVAEIESWRKEIYRPIYHIHKWWAQRLGSIFRAAILGTCLPKGSAIMELFYQPIRLPAPVVFDPFMGSGTTVGEAHKLGCTVIGRDINPVAVRSVKLALSPLSRHSLLALFATLEQQVGKELKALYRSVDRAGKPCDVLYYFWVKTLPCPECSTHVDLFSSYIFAAHAYLKKYPKVQILCPACAEIFSANHTDPRVTCPACELRFDPHRGPVSRSKARCAHCGHEFPIARTACSRGLPPDHRLYAKLILRQDGTKEYLKTTDVDSTAYTKAARQLRTLAPDIPKVAIRDGYNTRQVLSYGYSTWDQMFNERQHLALATLAKGIQQLPACAERDALMLLFSGMLEFNNMFASYKGEGTGAVRHMFSHHVLKPERTPIEANVWGTPKSSGAFSTLFHSRLLRALDYKQAPFEVAPAVHKGKKKGRKIFGLSPPIGAYLLDQYPKAGLPAAAVLLTCGDSARTDLPDSSVDFIVTDPPFFDNVHYSELADFFYVWQRIYFYDAEHETDHTTRSSAEVQDTDVHSFAAKLAKVFKECHRVLKREGLMIFSYHHSRDDGWEAVAKAVWGAGFEFVQAQPVKAEMAVATPKSRAKSPINLDVLLVCRKRLKTGNRMPSKADCLATAVEHTANRIESFNAIGRALSQNDIRVVLHSQLLVQINGAGSSEEAAILFSRLLATTSEIVVELHRNQVVVSGAAKSAQLSLQF